MFRIAPGTTPSLVEQMAAANPTNPFYTPRYAAYRLTQGFMCWILMSEASSGSDIYCPAFMKTGRLRRLLEIPSVPGASMDEAFWQGLLDFCRREGVSDISLNSFCSRNGTIPKLSHEKSRKTRWEYILDLKHPDTLVKMRKGHAYSIKRARKLGVEIRRASDMPAVKDHVRLIADSMQRRKERGEDVTTSVEIADFLQLTESGAGEVFQAVLDGKVVSSNVILISEKAGYNHTQGTSPEGMDCGAAHYLIHEIAGALRSEGKEMFNLGGTDDPDPESGLRKFKTGFGITTETHALEAARFEVGTSIPRLLRRLLSRD
ncbi:MAG TPA: GNAT family N-acetyltransferase [Nitrosospira sp.]|nr:GNAT family N-acetyltransferase [Nitrosospira sp.]